MNKQMAQLFYLIVTTMICGLLAWGGTNLTKIPIHAEKIKSMEDTLKEVSNNVKDMHWYFMARKGINAPKRK